MKLQPSTLVAVVVAALFAFTLGAAQGVAARETANGERFVVQLDAPPLAAYRGGIAGLAPTDPSATGARRLDASSAASRAYLAYLAQYQNDAIARAASAVGRSLDVRFRYTAAFNGFAATLTAVEAATVAQLSGVARVVPDSTRTLLTDNGPAWIGAPAVWSGSAGGAATRGEGVVVGVVDTGINTDHPSFADVGPVDGFDHANPRGRFFGVCDPVTGAPSCNDKLIGVYDFTPVGTGEDENGHGSHTSSTAAGNVVDAALVAPTITLQRRISGVAPHANVISYKACVGLTAPAGECLVSALLAAINQATLDGVDVINYSIGGGPVDPWLDADSQAFLNARRAGIFVSASAGNSGPGPGTVGSPANAPWVLTVGASTHDRKLTNGLDDMAGGATAPPADIDGQSLTSAYGPARIVYAGAPPYNSALCGAGAANPDGSSAINPFPPGTFNGEIVVCDRGVYGRVAKGENVKAGGAGGMVLVNDAANGNSLIADAHALPAVHISFANGQTLEAWLGSGSGHTGTIRGTVLDVRPENGDVMGSFSSRGPNVVGDVVKPDVTAPGVDILAAFSDASGPSPQYGVISGTSMSSPHSAGAAALVRALQPAWTPDEVKSALMTTGFTAGVRKEDASTPADPFDMGGGRVDVSLAVKAGLVLDESATNYDAANPNLGGDPRALNLASLADDGCAGACSWTRVVTSTASGPVTWTASAAGSGGLGLTVAPATFTLNPGQSRAIIVTADTSGLEEAAWVFGRVQLDASDPAVPDATLPVAVRAGEGEPTVPTVTLHFHGNVGEHASGHAGERDCTGDGKTDLVACSGPMLLRSGELSPSPAASWKGGPAEWAIDGGNDRTIHDPNWIWCLREDASPTEFQCPETETPAPGETTVEGPMSIEWWAQCALTCSVFGTTWDVEVYADGVRKVRQRVEAGPAPTGVPTLLRATVDVPRFTASHRIVVELEPVFLIDQAVEFTLMYDSTQPCGPSSSGPCDSVVRMPVVQDRPNSPPDAVDDAASVPRDGSVDVDVLANDTDPDGDTLTVESFTQPAFGTVSKNPDGTLRYTNDAATASDSFTYTASDGRGGSDTATVDVTVTGPDLVVANIAVNGRRGHTSTITATVANVGTSDAPATKTEFVLDDTTVLGLVDTAAIPAGGSADVSLQWDTRHVEGEHTIEATADRSGDAAETNEGNNAATLTVTVSGNKVRNGSFEQSSNGTAPDNWSSSGETGYAEGGSDGEKSVTTGPGGVWLSDAVDVVPGRSYDFAVDVTGAGGTATLEQLSADGAIVATLPLPLAAAPFGVFETITATLTIADGVAQVRIRLAGSLAGTAGFDNVGLWER